MNNNVSLFDITETVKDYWLKHDGRLTLQIIRDEGVYSLDPSLVLRVKNYKKDKILRINEWAWRAQPDWYYLYDKKTGTCNITAAEHFGIELKSVVKNPAKFEFKKQITLRGYQLDPLNELLQKPFWLLFALVAFGKTFSLWHIAHKLQCKMAILCNTKVNAQQCADRLSKFFWEDKVGMFYWEKKEFKDITVIVYPSYKKFLELYNGQYDALIIDECDIYMSDEMRNLTMKTKAQRKYWLTWTPYNDSFRLTDMKLWRWRIVEAKEYNESLVNQFQFHIYWVEAWDSVKEYEHYRDLKKQINIQDDRMNALKWSIEQWLKKGNKIIVLTDTKEFTKQINKDLWYAAMTSDDNKKKRAEKFEQFEKDKVLCATSGMVGRWYDDCEVDVVIIAFSGRAESPIIQALGRWLRSMPGKDHVYIYDIYNPSPLMRNQRSQRKRYYERFTSDVNVIKFV